MSPRSKHTRSFCTTCRQETNHDVLGTKQRFFGNDYIDWRVTYDFLACPGCENVSLRVTSDNSEEKNVAIYPPAENRLLPDWVLTLPEPFTKFATMGLHAIIDQVANNKVGDVGTFRPKLDALEAGEFMSSYQRKFVSAAIDAGHAASHRAFRPPARTLNRVIDIIEHLLQGTYVLQNGRRRGA